jgi:curli biogenesis system outer membrane secretion channel CsgG
MKTKSVLSAHPDDNLLAGFQDGSLTGQEHERVLAHLETCAFCRDVVFFSLQNAEIVDTKKQTTARQFWPQYGPMVAVPGFAALLVIAATLTWVSHPHRNSSTEAKRLNPTHSSKNPPEVASTAPNPAIPSLSPGSAQAFSAHPGSTPIARQATQRRQPPETAKAATKPSSTTPQFSPVPALAQNPPSPQQSFSPIPAPIAPGVAQGEPPASADHGHNSGPNANGIGSNSAAVASMVGHSNPLRSSLYVVSPPALTHKARIAILDFDYATVQSNSQAIFGANVDIGKGIRDLVVNDLAKDGDYIIIDRATIDKMLAEQNFSNSNRADPATVAKIGALMGVDAMIIGDITTFGNDNKHYGGSGGGGGWHGIGGGGLGLSKSKTIVEITARLVDVNTGEVIASVNGRGETDKTSLSAGGGGCAWWNGCGGGALDMSSSDFQNTAIGRAVKQSVTQLASSLDSKAATLPAVAVAPPPPTLDGVIADASTSDIIINVGSKAGLKVGDRLQVWRMVRVVKDPVGGKPLRSIENPVGTLTITSVNADSAVGNFSGSGKPQTGDTVKSQ